ncbi:CHAP domain-containing protein [Arthrobacter glacialis]|uniref:CHAP domain-containing protein n=1 Tax=Arthrobacter glacialis TaxID=1664 RepID=UPI000CD3C17F|nr:CHAP domain-containing protein [Arthrobacter glacialis]POH58254.1 hypothetical protein CVS28_12485 [Arthrobacter glacialis]
MAAVSGSLAFAGVSGAYAVAEDPESLAGPQVNEEALQASLDGSTNGFESALGDNIATPLAGSPLSTVDAFITQWNNKYIDVDGSYGAQCWDLWEKYCRSVIGCSGISTQFSPNPGYASALWDGYARNGASSYFTQVSASSTPVKGDVAIWKYGQHPYYPYSHVAIVIGDAGGNVNVLSQNSSPSVAGNPYPGMSTGPSIKQNLTKAGLAGYLRPKSLPGGPSGGRPSIRSKADLLAVDSAGVLWNYPATGAGGFGTKIMIGGGWIGMVSGWTVDWTGNGILDMVIKWSDGTIRLYPGGANGGFGTYSVIGQGWTNIEIVPARWRSTDTRPGMIAKLANGDLYYYPNVSGAAMSSSIKIGIGWSGLSLNSMNFNGDANADIIAQDSTGQLLLYPGTGTGGFSAKSVVGHGFHKTGLIANTGFNGSGSKGLLFRTAAGLLNYYPLSAAGAFQNPVAIGPGWTSFKLFNTQ